MSQSTLFDHGKLFNMSVSLLITACHLATNGRFKALSKEKLLRTLNDRRDHALSVSGVISDLQAKYGVRFEQIFNEGRMSALDTKAFRAAWYISQILEADNGQAVIDEAIYQVEHGQFDINMAM